MSDTRLLIRTTALDDRLLAFGDELAAASGHPVAYVVDERRGPVPSRGREVVGLTDAGCAELGLHGPADFAWKCGDYAYYFARRRFPDARWLWLIEYDVRFAGGNPAEFFAFFAAHPHVDLLAAYFAAAKPDWYWTQTLYARDAAPHRCLFPVTRLSVRAVDAAYAKRVEHSNNPLRKLVWPNDEAFVATTLVQAGLDCRDLNAFGRTFYTPETFTFTEPLDGDAFVPSDDGLRLYHPVLYGDAYRRKIERLTAPPFEMRFVGREVRRVARALNRVSRW